MQIGFRAFAEVSLLPRRRGTTESASSRDRIAAMRIALLLPGSKVVSWNDRCKYPVRYHALKFKRTAVAGLILSRFSNEFRSRDQNGTSSSFHFRYRKIYITGVQRSPITNRNCSYTSHCIVLSLRLYTFTIYNAFIAQSSFARTLKYLSDFMVAFVTIYGTHASFIYTCFSRHKFRLSVYLDSYSQYLYIVGEMNYCSRDISHSRKNNIL